MKLVVEVLDAAGLAIKDAAHGTSSPFVEVELAGQRLRTATKLHDLSPSWRESLVFSVPDPSLFPSLRLDVSILHDRRAAAASSVAAASAVYDDDASAADGADQRGHLGPATSFLGRVRISPSMITATSAADAQPQRFPLEKRGVFSRVSGDIALLLYNLPDSSDPPAGDAYKPLKTTNSSCVRPDHPSPVANSEASTTDEPPAPAPRRRVFYSVPSSTGVKTSAVAAAAPPPPPGTTVVMPRPPSLVQPRPEFGLVETRPPLAARLPTAQASKIASTYDMVEPMPYLYVSVVKARDLPPMDATGSIDPYVEVKLGNYKGRTRHLERNPNPVFRQIFAFNKEHLQASQLEVAVKDRDLVKDDFVGRVIFDLAEVPHRVPPDSPLAPQWYRLEDKRGDKLRHGGEVMLSVWVGTQADEAFSEAWHSDAHSVGLDALPHTRSKVYFSPRLAYLRVVVLAAQDLVPADVSRPLAAAIRLQLGGQLLRTRPGAPPGSPNPTWGEEFIFVAAEPFDEPLVITAEDRVAPGRDEPIGRLFVNVASQAVPRNDHGKAIQSKWYSLARPEADADEAAANADAERKKTSKFSSKVHLRLSLDTAYHVLDESAHFSSDFRPASKNLWKSPVGLLELGILSARNLAPTVKAGHVDPFCVAKYGPKWVRTRTLLNTLAPQWNEQYTWQVFDPCTVITVAVFDNCHITGGQDGSDIRDQRIGKVRIRLSTLETDRVYTHFYSLLVLHPAAGLKKTGELHLAVRFTCTAWVNMLALYGRPLLPKMHYTQPLTIKQLDYLRHHAMQIVASRLARAEPPLRREVVEYMLDVDAHMFSLRRSKANFQRAMLLFAVAAAIGRWFRGVQSWRNPITTLLVHVLYFILVLYPELILPTLFLYLSAVGAMNYQTRPQHPPHMDTRLSHAELVQPDELDEEFDTFPTSRSTDVVRMRYDRLRSVGGRVQMAAGDLATQLERAHALLKWRDPRATAIFIFLALVVAVLLYVTPFQAVLIVAGIVLLRHPRFRSKLPSPVFNYYKRLPAKSDMLL